MFSIGGAKLKMSKRRTTQESVKTETVNRCVIRAFCIASVAEVTGHCLAWRKACENPWIKHEASDICGGQVGCCLWPCEWGAINLFLPCTSLQIFRSSTSHLLLSWRRWTTRFGPRILSWRSAFRTRGSSVGHGMNSRGDESCAPCGFLVLRR